jgi:glucokinase
MEQSEEYYAIGLDVGATKIAAALVSRDGTVLASHQAPTGVRLGPQAVLDRIAAEADALAQDGDGRLKGIGIGSPGQVFSDQGVVRNAVNMGWERVNLVEEIRSRLAVDLPVWIQKDANASALGEYYYGAARGCEDFIYLGVGSGLGGGVMVGGRLVTGYNWNAAEVGHLSLDPAGLRCACGQLGCAETVVSGPGLVTATRQVLARQDPAPATSGARPTSSLPADDTLTPARILSAARQGDPAALQGLEAVGRALGVVAAAAVALLNPARIILGGGLGVAAFDFLVPPLQEELKHRTLEASLQDLHILPSQLESPAVGSACLVWYGSKLKAGD